MVKDEKKERQGRMYLAMPVLMLPFLTLMFWALGGGKGSETLAAPVPLGLNAEIPGATDKAQPLDKMAFYAVAEQDSLKRLKELKKDPYYSMQYEPEEEDGYEGFDEQYQTYPEPPAGRYGSRNLPNDRQEEQIYKKLAALQNALKEPEQLPEKRVDAVPGWQQETRVPGDLDRLEQMMNRMMETPETDPEMDQVNKVLEQVLDIQHPERVRDRLKRESLENKGNVLPVSVDPEIDPVTLLESQAGNGPGYGLLTDERNGFYSLDDGGADASAEITAIPAVIHETQTLVNGATVKLRLTKDVYINGSLIPSGMFVFGEAALNGDRLTVEVSSIRSGNALFPVKLKVFDMDGMEGVNIPGAISRDAAKQSGDRTIQGLGMTTLDPSLAAQAASAGIELTRNLLSRKVKLIKVQVKAGYQVLLRDEKISKK